MRRWQWQDIKQTIAVVVVHGCGLGSIALLQQWSIWSTDRSARRLQPSDCVSWWPSRSVSLQLATTVSGRIADRYVYKLRHIIMRFCCNLCDYEHEQRKACNVCLVIEVHMYNKYQNICNIYTMYIQKRWTNTSRPSPPAGISLDLYIYIYIYIYIYLVCMCTYLNICCMFFMFLV